MAKYAANNEIARSVRRKLFNELEDYNSILLSWKDKKASMVKMIIEGDQVVNRDKFDNIVEEMLPHGVFKYEKYPSDAKEWAETHVLFHVD